MRLFSRTKQTPGWLALDFLPDAVCIAHVRRVLDGKPQVTFCGMHPLDASNPATLEKLGKTLRLKQYQCTTLLDPGDYQLLVVEAPSVPPQEMKTAVRWRIKDLLDFRVEEAAIDVLEIPAQQGSKQRSLYAVAARNEVIRNCQSRFEEADIPLAAIDVPEMAQRNIAALLETPGRGLALLSFDAGGGLLTFTSGGELYHFRRIEVSLSQLTDADSERRQRSWERIVLELQRSLDHFDRNFHFIALNGLLLAPLPNQSELREYLAANLYVPLETLNLETIFDFSGAPEMAADMELQAQCFLTLGAALRLEE